MNIIHLVMGKANPQRMNGVNKVAYQLAKTQHETGLQVSVWGITKNPVHDYPVRAFNTRLFVNTRLGLSKELRAALSALTPDTVVQIHGVFIPVLDRVAVFLKQINRAYIITPHGALAKAAMARHALRKRVYFSCFTLPVLLGAANVQMLGEQESEDLFHLAPTIRQVLVPNGQDLKEIPDFPTRSENQIPVFGYCGRLDSYHKGLDLMLEAFKTMLAQGTAARLIVIGDGKDRRKLERYCAVHRLEQGVVFCGAQYGVEKFRLLASCDFFLHTSRMEGFPVAVLEAAALGLPCLTTKPTSMNRYLERHQAGFAIPQVAVDSILTAMQEAVATFKKPRFRELSHNARQMIREVFSWEDVARQLTTVYQKALR